MARLGYTNFGPSEKRIELFEIVCGYLLLDPDEHSARVQALDYALRVAAREIGGNEMKHKAKEAGFDEVGGRVVHRCDTSVLPHADVTRLDQETTRYKCPHCGVTVTTSYEDR